MHCPSCGRESFMPVDALADELHRGIHDHMAGQGETWPSEVERLTYTTLDNAVALYLAFMASLDSEREPRPVH
jgi:hypothetical protein